MLRRRNIEREWHCPFGRFVRRRVISHEELAGRKTSTCNWRLYGTGGTGVLGCQFRCYLMFVQFTQTRNNPLSAVRSSTPAAYVVKKVANVLEAGRETFVSPSFFSRHFLSTASCYFSFPPRHVVFRVPLLSADMLRIYLPAKCCVTAGKKYLSHTNGSCLALSRILCNGTIGRFPGCFLLLKKQLDIWHIHAHTETAFGSISAAKIA